MSKLIERLDEYFKGDDDLEMTPQTRLKKLETFLLHATKFVFGVFEDGRPISYYYFEVNKNRQGGYRADWMGLYFISKKGQMVSRDDSNNGQELIFDNLEDAVESTIQAFRSLISPDTDIITFFTLRADDTLRFFQKLDALAKDLGVEQSGVTRESLLSAFQTFATARLPLKGSGRAGKA
jgi:hypothetical protein